MAPSTTATKNSPLPEPEELTASLWIPLLACCLYGAVLRSSYSSFQGTDPSPNVVFGAVWWSAPIVTSVLYLCVIFGLKKYMENREPFAIKDWMFTYNLYQTLFNSWCVYSFIKEVYEQGMPIWGSRIDNTPSGYHLGFLIWTHYNNKYIELLDTIFMAVRKKNKQISFLHMYHHILLIWAWFAVCKWGCGGDAYFGALCNSFVHVLMYGYYLLALLKINTPWKKWLTSIQMVQFCICFTQAVYVFVVDTYPRHLTALQMFVMLNMLVLFGQFYRNTYSNNKKPATELKPEGQQQHQTKPAAETALDAKQKAA